MCVVQGGEEVCCSYGARASAELLEEYGFVPRGNPPRARLLFALEEASRCFGEKADVLEQAKASIPCSCHSLLIFFVFIMPGAGWSGF